jgi:hypothetical protein
MLSISSHGNDAGTGIVWATLHTHDYESGDRIYAFDAETLEDLWDSYFPHSLPRNGKWLPPTIADSKLFLATADGGFAVYVLGPKPVRFPDFVPPWPPDVSKPPLPPYIPGPNPDPIPLASRFDSEEAIGGLQQHRRQQLAPPDGNHLLFAARTRAGANVQEEILHEIGGAQTTDAAILFGRREQSVWQAVDGSIVEAREEMSFPNPAKGGSPWRLFRVIKHQGQGRLSTVAWIQQLDFPWLAEIRYVFWGTRN